MLKKDTKTPIGTDQLDGLRFFAFAAVFFFHFQAGPEMPTLSFFQKQGWIGVEVFFAISAFLLFGLFQQEHDKVGRINVSQFYIRRLLRIYPLMMVFSIAMLVTYSSPSWAAVGWLAGLASFVGNYIYWFPEKAQAVPNTAHLWTLAYEFQIYMILPLLFFAYRAVGKRAFVAGLICALPICLVGRAAFVMSGISSQAVYVTPILRPEATIAGILVGIGVTRGISIKVACAALLCSLAGLYILPDMHTASGTVGVYLVTGLFAGSLLHVALYADAIGAFLRWAPIAYLGRISFGLYVFHLWAFTTAMTMTRMTPIHESYATRCIAGLAFCIAAATASYHLFERPLLRLKPRSYGPKMTAGSPPIAASIASAVGSLAKMSVRVFQRS
ncbi:acyltransferase [Mesorhizobium sp. M0146]|uniref:acyltransferase family protein n=1 Tax=unclassified Mesorhizobium TaxID=325217 RepID=UPI00333975FB